MTRFRSPGFVRSARVLVALVLAAGIAACTSHKPPVVVATPKYPDFPKLDVPPEVAASPEMRRQFDEGWQRLQADDLRGAAADFSDILKQSPDFYPAETALGYVAVAQKQFKDAVTHFAAAIAKNDRYMPAVQGEIDAALAGGDDAAAISGIQLLLTIDPSRDELRGRLDALRLRLVQSELTAAASAREAGRLADAQAILTRALQAAPSSSAVLRELASVELAQGSLDPAEEHARKAIQLDATDAESLAVLGNVLEKQGKTREAADTYKRAVAIDPRPAWRQKVDALVARANFEALPADYRAIPTAETVTRGQLAAMIGIDLKPLIDQAPKKPAVVITDVRTHWAAPWILPVAQASVMDVFANHTFQPNSAIRRSDLAQVVSQLLSLVGARRPNDLAAWRAARPKLVDVSAGYVSYRAIGMVVAAGAMKLDDDGKFWPSRAATGEEVVAAVARIRQLAGR
jgi:tetratricopeptide (TPR) repeat protein